VSSNNPTEANRIAVVGDVVSTNEQNQMTEVSVTYQKNPTWIPNACIKDTIKVSAQSLHLLQDATLENGLTVKVADNYKLDTNGDAAIQDAADLWIEFGEVQQNESESVSFTFTSAEPSEQVKAASQSISFESASDDDADDSVPNFEGQSIELSEVVEQDEEKAAKKKLNAIEKAALAREERYSESKAVVESLNTDISKAMAGGKRAGDIGTDSPETLGAWNYECKAYELVMKAVDPVTGEVSYHEARNENGDPHSRAIVNPTLADEDNPLGVIINPRIGNNFEAIDHPTVFNPIIECVRGINESAGQEVITWDAFSFNKGARAILNLDVTGFANSTRQKAAENLSQFGYVNLSANRISDALVEEEGGHRIGISIMNANDGKSALQAFMSVLRTYCGNLAMRGGVQNLLMAGNRDKIRHMKGVVSEFDPETFATRITSAMLESRKNLIATNIFRHLPIEANMFDKVMTVFNNHGLVAQPKVTVQVADLDQLPKDKNGNPMLNAASLSKDAVKILGGHAYNTVHSGWMNPDLDYVALTTEADKAAAGTMFHAMQTVSGMITHNPIWTDGKRLLKGNKQGVETMMKRSTKATNMFEEIAFAAVDTYAKAMAKEVQVGKDDEGNPIYEVQVQPVDDLEAMGQWFKENPDKLMVPYGKPVLNADGSQKYVNNQPKFEKKVLTPMGEIPEFHETWKVTVQAQAN
tara:strand:+ start:2825 stop:4921 length:2097 start_codon:yes stop_codon:yes gene_type:complete